MYHVAKVLKVFQSGSDDSKSADNSVQALLEMWDDNNVILMVHPALVSEIKEKDYVFVRYTQPEAVVIKILKPKEGKEIFEKMAEFHERKKRAVSIPLVRDNPANRMIG